MKNTNWTNPRIAVAVVFAALGSMAIAADTKAPPTTTEEIRSFYHVQKMAPKTVFKLIDTNKDGLVSKDEFMGFMGKLFEKWDTNADGKISKDEWKGGLAKAKASQDKSQAGKNQPRSE